VFLKDLWPSPDEVREAIVAAISPDQFDREYARIFDGDEHWAAMSAPTGAMYDWDEESTYVREPPFFAAAGDPYAIPVATMRDVEGARILVKVGDSVTTDHISPAGSIKADSPAGQWLQEHGVKTGEFNSYGARRGNHEVMMRGTFANIRLRNELAPGTEGPWTTHLPSGERMSIFDAAVRYRADGVALAVLAGKEYGSGSSRDWAAKGPSLLGVRFVIAESYERIHRSNLVGMGILPLQYREGENAETLGLTGSEELAVRGLTGGFEPRAELTVEVTRRDGTRATFQAVARVDEPAELEYFRAGGILQMVLDQVLASS